MRSLLLFGSRLYAQSGLSLADVDKAFLGDHPQFLQVFATRNGKGNRGFNSLWHGVHVQSRAIKWVTKSTSGIHC